MIELIQNSLPAIIVGLLITAANYLVMRREMRKLKGSREYTFIMDTLHKVNDWSHTTEGQQTISELHTLFKSVKSLASMVVKEEEALRNGK